MDSKTLTQKYEVGGALEIIQEKELAEKSLRDVAVEINSEYAYGLSMAQKATETMLNVGRMLLKAREKFPGDKEFGQWRKKYIDFSGSHVSRLMAVAREFGEVQDSYLLPISTLAELLPASTKLKDEVIANAKMGEKPSVRNVRKKVQGEAKFAPNRVVPAPDPKPANQTEEPPPNPFDDEIHKPFLERLKKENDSFVIFGMTPAFDGTYNEEVIEALYIHWCSYDMTPKQQNLLDAAHKDIKFMLYATDVDPLIKGTYR